MDWKDLQAQIKYFKDELLALKCPQGTVRSIGTYYYDMYETVPSEGLIGTYTINFSSDTDLAPIIALSGMKSITPNVFLGKYNATANTQKLFVLSETVSVLVLLSTREITSITKD